ncbi:MAG TPA: LPS assembly protein LptD [Myxococcota bacterium]|nr:LPS assembly protein LptD [Myxococcota bacterium]
MRRLGALFAASALALAAASHAQEPEPTKPPPPTETAPPQPVPDFILTADVVDFDRDRDLYEATGNVKIVQADGRVMTSDWALFNGTTRTGVASGNVVVVDAQNTVRAQFMAIDMNSTVSVGMNGTLDNPQPGVSVRGEVIERTGVDTYHIENANFSSCHCSPDKERRPWEVQAKAAEVEVPGYAVGHDLWFKVFGIPVIYVPWLTFPVKEAKQTGFLLPSYKHSHLNGSEIDLPFYWAIADNVNAMITPNWVSRRGFATTGTIEYATETSTGRAGGSLLPNDRQVENDSQEFFSPNRWAYWWKHQQMIAPGWSAGVDMMALSDNNMTFDFPRLLGRDLQHQRALESLGWIDGAMNGLFVQGVLSVQNDLQNPNDLDRDRFLLQQLPDLRASLIPHDLFGTPIQASITSRYTDFVQFGGQMKTWFGHAPVHGQFYDTGTDGRFDTGEPTATGGYGSSTSTNPNFDPNLDDFGNPKATTHTEGDGIFEEGEPLADAGSRIDLYPKIDLPFHFGPVQTYTEGGVRETVWFPNVEDVASRTMFTLRGDAFADFGRTYLLGTLPLSHIIEPRIRFAGIWAPNQSDDPLFIPEPAQVEPRLIDGDIRLITDDPSDRVADARLLQLQLANRLYGPPRAEGAPPRLLGEFTIGSGYDWMQGGFTRLFALAEVRPSQAWEVGLDGGYDPQDGHLQDMRATVGWTSDAGSNVRLSYRYNRDPTQVFEGFLDRGEEYNGSRTPTNRVNQVTLQTYLLTTSWLEFFAEGYKSLESGGVDGGFVGVVLRSSCKCWDALIEIEKLARTNDTSVSFQFRLTGMGDQARLSDLDRRGRTDQGP